MLPESYAHLQPLFSQIASIIQQNQRFLVTAHRHPDGDAVGSALGLTLLLRRLGKDVVLFNDTPYPMQFHFLEEVETLQTDLQQEAPFDVTILCDCGEVSRAPEGFPEPPQRGFFLVIDHHATCAREGELNLNESTAPAVGLLIYQLAHFLQVPIDLPIAQALYCSLVSDTGSFRYQKTTPYTMRVAAELLEIGVNPWEISSNLFESNPLERQRLLALALDTIEMHHDGQLAYLTITQQMYQRTNTTHQESDGFINFARGIRGVEVAVLFSQRDEEAQQWKLSLRSRGSVNVSAIASQFGGGGHFNAAGALLSGELHDLKTRVQQATAQQLIQGNPTAQPTTPPANNPIEPHNR